MIIITCFSAEGRNIFYCSKRENCVIMVFMGIWETIMLVFVGGVSLLVLGFSLVTHITTCEMKARKKAIREILEIIRTEKEYPTPWAEASTEQMYKDMTEYGPKAMQLFAQLICHETKKSLIRRVIQFLQKEGLIEKEKEPEKMAAPNVGGMN